MLKRACLALFLVATAPSSPVTANELTPDLLQAVTQLAEEGDADSQAYLARLHEVGQGVPKDFGIALRWYRLAAAQGNTTARVNLGLMTLYGKGCEKNPTEAVRLFRLGLRIGQIRASNQRKLERVLRACETPRTIAAITREVYPRVDGYDALLALEKVGAYVEHLDQIGELAVANVDEVEAGEACPPRYRRA